MAATPEAPAGPGRRPGPVPPTARRVPRERTYHGDTVVDEYAWLAGKDDPETTAYLEAENAYTEAMTAGQDGLREAIFGEIKGRTQETDLSVPTRKGGWWYSRIVEGQQYAVHGRCAARPGQTAPPPADEGGPLPGEEILLDCNELAGDAPFFSLGAFSVSPDGRLLAYSMDFAVTERTRCGSRTWPPGRSPRTRSPTPTTAAPGPRTGPRCSTSRPTRRGVPTVCGGTWWAPRPPTT